MMLGRVKWFNPERGYGFIAISETEDAFVHFTSINMEGFRTLCEGDRVQYDIARRPDDYMAINVTPID